MPTRNTRRTTPPPKPTQKEKLLKLLQEGKTITSAAAKTRYKIASLSARVNELRKDGYDITATKRVVRDRETGRKRQVVSYGLE